MVRFYKKAVTTGWLGRWALPPPQIFAQAGGCFSAQAILLGCPEDGIRDVPLGGQLQSSTRV